MDIRDTNLAWHRSTRCGSSACVETAADSDAVYMRDGKDPRGPVLAFSHAAWRDLIDGVKGDGFTASSRGDG